MLKNESEYLLGALTYLLCASGHVEGVQCSGKEHEVRSGLSRELVSIVGRRIADHLGRGEEIDSRGAIRVISEFAQGDSNGEVVRGVDASSFCSGGRWKACLAEAEVGVDIDCVESDRGSEGQVSGVHSVVSAGGAVNGVCELSVSRGKHYRKNKAKALRRKQMGSAARTSIVAESRQDPQRDRAFASCSDEVRAELQLSRAEMLIARNRADKVKAESCVRHYEMVKQSRVNETRFELRRQTSEEKLRAISKKRLGEGYVEGTVYSSDAAASLSSGSVSPNSSISMAELKRREEMYRAMEAKVAAMTLERSKMIEEKKTLEKKYSVYEAQEANRKQLAKERAAIQRSVGMDGYSRWD